MTSQTQAVEKGTVQENTLSLGRRLVWIAIIWAVQLIYLPTSERAGGGIGMAVMEFVISNFEIGIWKIL